MFGWVATVWVRTVVKGPHRITGTYGKHGRRDMNILLVDDDPKTRRTYQEILNSGKHHLLSADSESAALEWIRSAAVDIVIAAHGRHGFNGLRLCRLMREAGFGKRNVYTILVGDQNPDSELLGNLGRMFNDYVKKPVNPIDLSIRVSIGARVVSLEEQISRNQNTTGMGPLSTVRVLSHLLRVYNEDLGNHCNRVAELSLKLAKAHPEVSEKEYPLIRTAALLHDIGMICVPEGVLRKSRTEMTAEERILYQSHSIQGESILNENEALRPAAQLVRMHHEQYNGKGFPDALEGRQIPLLARIIAAASMYDNLVHRGRFSFEEIPERLRRLSGYQLDPGLFDSLMLLNMENMDADARRTYREVAFEELETGMVFARNVRMRSGAMAMPLQTAITAEVLDKLFQYHDRGYLPDKFFVLK